LAVSWEAVDAGWGRRAPAWAYLLEKQYWGAYAEIFDRLDLGPGTRYLDIACGSGLAGHIASRRGAEVSGLDAAARLLEIARVRTPTADWRTGDMYTLPWADGSFDAVTSFNGIWGPDQAALAEAVRVTRPGGLLALTFWGDLRKMPGFPLFVPLAICAPPEAVAEQVSEVAIGRPGVAEAMYETAGIEVVERGRLEITWEFPDVDTAAAALAASGPAYAGVVHSGEEAVTAAFREAAEQLIVPGAGVRADLNWGYLVGRRSVEP
jgi:SAM-dependent methyltransferase